jgi:hypothetical protein
MLGYCTNVHSGVSFSSVIENLKTYTALVQKQMHKPIGVGLWFSDIASREVDISLLIDTLQSINVQAFTLNGFPFCDFHQKIVRHSVYEPNWSVQTRLDYTIRLAHILSKITTQKEASISTLPLGWNSSSFSNNDASAMLQKCVDALEEIEQKTGKCIHLAIETEPGCRLQRSQELCEFIEHYFGNDERTRRYIRVCHDTCHAAVMRESAESCIQNYKNAGLKIGKVQLSSAIEIDFDKPTSNNVTRDLSSISEPRYLHQTTVCNKNAISFYENILDVPTDLPVGHWLIHFHVPIHLRQFGSLHTTQNDLIESIPHLREAGVTDWEVETYTWSVTPNDLQEDELVASITKELEWASNQLNT